MNKLIHGDCLEELNKLDVNVDLTFLDPPFNQGKDYKNHDDDMPENEYWAWLEKVCKLIYNKTINGGAIYFMQREKNTSFVLDTLVKSGWIFQNLIIWKKKSSAVPGRTRFAKQYQIIAYATKGDKPNTFNKLRIQPTLLVTEKYERKTGMFSTDVWEDIRELTSGYYAGSEPITHEKKRVNKQQSPISLLTRIILTSTKINDLVLDVFAGTGTSVIVSNQLQRRSIGIELDHENISIIKNRINNPRQSDIIEKLRKDYFHTENLDTIWPKPNP